MRLQISISLQAAELEMLDRLATRLNLSRSACVKLLVARYYADHHLRKFWDELQQQEEAKGKKRPEVAGK